MALALAPLALGLYPTLALTLALVMALARTPLALALVSALTLTLALTLALTLVLATVLARILALPHLMDTALTLTLARGIQQPAAERERLLAGPGARPITAGGPA
jgi:hypothetical protein